jgi:hypothetical protein
MSPRQLSRKTKMILEEGSKWVMDKSTQLWQAHVQALHESEAYRKQFLVLTAAILAIVAFPTPIDVIVTAALTAYVAAKSRSSRNGWNPDDYWSQEQGW